MNLPAGAHVQSESSMSSPEWVGRIADDCGDEYVAAIGRTLDDIDSIDVDDGTRFEAELGGELRRARMGLFTAIGLRLGELTLEACPTEKEAFVINAATTLANPIEADRSEVTRAKEVVSFHL